MVKRELASIDPVPCPLILNTSSPRNVEIDEQKFSTNHPDIKGLVQREIDASPMDSKHSQIGRDTSVEGQFPIIPVKETSKTPNQAVVSKSDSTRASLARTTANQQVSFRKFIAQKTIDEKKCRNLKKALKKVLTDYKYSEKYTYTYCKLIDARIRRCFESGIHKEKMNLFIPRYYNMLSLIRLFLIVCIIVSLQTMQCGQTISLLLTQFGFLVYTYIGIFKYKMNLS